MTTALAGAFLGLAAGGASAAGPFGTFSLNGTYVIQAHGFQQDNNTPTDTGQNAILGLVTFNGTGGVTGGGFSFTHNDSVPSDPPTSLPETINCSVSITGGSYTVSSVTGAGTVTLDLAVPPGFQGGSPVCTTLSSPASLTFAFVLNNSFVATSAPVQLIGFTPVPLSIGGEPPLPPSGFQLINGMNLQGTLSLQQ